MNDDRKQRHVRRIEAFREVVRERTGRISLAWIQLEGGDEVAGGLEGLMRELHTLKGESSLTGFAAAARAAHALEDLVQAVHTGACQASAIGDLLFDGLDAITTLIDGDPTAGADVAEQLEVDVHALVRGTRPTRSAPAPARDPRATATTPARPGDLSVRVTAHQLDRMRHVLGELLLSRLRVSGAAGELGSARESLSAQSALSRQLSAVEAGLRDEVARMANLISALEALARELRMTAIGRLFDEFPRGVRELARSLGRELRLDTHGGDVEADREVIELLREPLLHLIRNAVDHGLEAPAERVALGKPERGTVRLHAELMGDAVRVQVADDGRGIDVDTVRKRALDLGLLDAPSARVLSDDQVLAYLFSSGFTTRAGASEVSGRGVGLDVVKETMAGIGGSVSVHSERGVGTTFTLTAPITTSIISVVLFEVGGERYALPASQVTAVLDRAGHDEVDSIDGVAIEVGGERALVVPMDRIVGAEQVGRCDRLLLVRSHQTLIALDGTSGHFEREAVILPPGEAVDPEGLVVGGVAEEGRSPALVLDPKVIRDLAKRNAIAWRAAEATSGSPTRADRTVLVVEDSPIMRDVVAESLRAYGLLVVEAGDGAEALELLAAGTTIDLLVTDLEMPHVDGFELIERMRADEGSRRVPAVVVSTRGSEADKMAAMKVGADAYVVKSEFSREGLWATVSRFV